MANKVESEKMIAFIDLDGTLLNSRLELSEATIATIGHVVSAGHEIVFASGRPLQSVKMLCSSANLKNGYAIASNGAVTWDFEKQRIARAFCISREIVSEMLAIARQYSVNIALYESDCWYVGAHDEFSTLEELRSGTRPRSIIDSSTLGFDIVKVMFIGEPKRLAFIKKELEDTRVDIVPFFSYPEYLELLVEGSSKSVAANAVLEELSLSWQETIVIGDGINDIDLMRPAKYRVAVGNAKAAVKAVANIIAPTNDCDGAAVALSALLLKDKESKKLLQIEQEV